MRRFMAIAMLVAFTAWAADEPQGAPKLLDAQYLPIEIESAALQRQYDALATMSLQTLEYTSQGPIQTIDGDTGVVLPSRARDLKKGDSGADILQLFKDVLLATGNETLVVRENTLVDATTRNLSFSQSIRGIPVIFGDVSIEVNDETRRVLALSATFIPDRNLPSTPKLSAQEAEQIVPQALEMAKDARAKNVEIDEGTYLAYFVNPTEPKPASMVWVVRATLNDGDREDFFVDAATGEIVRRAPADNYLTRIVYDVNNISVPYPNIPDQYRLTTQAQINANATAKQAYDNVAKANTNLGLRFPSAVGNFPQTVKIVVNWPFQYPTASHGIYSGTDYLRFSGESQDTYSTGKPLNIVTHEFAHGFADREVGSTVNLTDNQAGALEESFSDIMGTVADIVDGADPGLLSATWVHAHGKFKSSPSTGSRSFRDPTGDARATFRTVSQDWFPGRWRGVGSELMHYNSTILSHAYYLLVFGGTHARAGDPGIPVISVPAQTETKARNIFMRAYQDVTMNNEPNFKKMKTAAIQAANSLYSGTGANTATKKAFEAVGICGVSSTPPPKMTLTSLGDLLCAGRFNPTWDILAGATQYFGEVAPSVLGFSFAVPVTNVDGGTDSCFFQVSQPSLFRIQACNDCGCGPWSDVEYLEYWSPCP